MLPTLTLVIISTVYQYCRAIGRFLALGIPLLASEIIFYRHNQTNRKLYVRKRSNTFVVS